MEETVFRVETRPTVTVIIPTYNLGRVLRYSIESVLLQDFSDFEVWVVGDGCTDDTEAVVRSFTDARIHWMNLPENSGTPAMPRNEGLKRARGDYIAYLGHDDLWFPWHLSELVDALKQTNCDFAWSIGVTIEPPGVAGTFTMPEKPWDGRHHLSPSNWLHRKGLTDRTGLWPSRVRHGDDRAFVRQAILHGTSMTFRSRLTAMKFPAASWRMYTLKASFPQEKYLLSMQKDPERLRLSLLSDCAALLSRRETPPGESPYRKNLPAPVIRLFRWVIAFYGPERWPLNMLYFRIWKKRSGL